MGLTVLRVFDELRYSYDGPLNPTWGFEILGMERGLWFRERELKGAGC